MDRRPLSGAQHSISYEGYEAAIASVGGSLRMLRHEGRDLIVPFAAEEIRPAYRGAVLAPWPNRVVDGRYSFDGEEQQLALTEPERGHALHGLVAWAEFAAAEVADDRVGLLVRLPAQAGYPHPLEIRVAYSLDTDGLTTTVTATNLGSTGAPWGTGPHPYLVAGPGRVDDWTLELPADQVLTVTDDRLVPIDVVDVASEQDGRWDFRTARVLGDTFIDHAFTQLRRDDAGLATVRVTSPAGSGVRMSWDASCGWVQVHTADVPDAARSRRGLAVEPMTCAPDAFNSGRGLIRLEPGQSSSASWRIGALSAG